MPRDDRGIATYVVDQDPDAANPIGDRSPSLALSAAAGNRQAKNRWWPRIPTHVVSGREASTVGHGRQLGGKRSPDDAHLIHRAKHDFLAGGPATQSPPTAT